MIVKLNEAPPLTMYVRQCCCGGFFFSSSSKYNIETLLSCSQVDSVVQSIMQYNNAKMGKGIMFRL